MAESALLLQRQAPPDGSEALNPFPGLELRRRATLMQFWQVLAGLLLAMSLWVLAVLVLVWSAVPDTLDVPLLSLQSLWRLPGYPAWVWPLASTWLLVGALVCSICFRHCALRPVRSFLAACHAQVLDAGMRSAITGIGFEPDNHFCAADVDGTGLFTQRCGAFTSDGRFEGHYRGVKVQIGAVTIREHSSSKPAAAPVHFAGALLAAEFPLQFNVATRLLPKGSKCKSVKGEQRATLKDEQLTQIFDVRCTDPIHLNQNLTSDTVQALAQLAQAYPGLRLRIAQNQLVVLVSGDFPLFQASLWKPVLNQNQAQPFIAALSATLTLTEALRKQRAPDAH